MKTVELVPESRHYQLRVAGLISALGLVEDASFLVDPDENARELLVATDRALVIVHQKRLPRGGGSFVLEAEVYPWRDVHDAKFTATAGIGGEVDKVAVQPMLTIGEPPVEIIDRHWRENDATVAFVAACLRSVSTTS